jgi:uncharacterized protein (TIGR03067 family)
MRVALLLVLATPAMVAADGPTEDKVQTALTKLQGTWVVRTAVIDGEDLTDVPGLELVFAGTKATLRHPRRGEMDKFHCKVDPTAFPQTMNLRNVVDAGTFLCIYEIKGDVLRLCLNRAEQPRPTEFTDKGCALLTLKRPNTERGQDVPRTRFPTPMRTPG